MANHKLRTVVAVTLETIQTNNGYIAPAMNATVNTQTLVLERLLRNPLPVLDNNYLLLADEIIGFFSVFENMEKSKAILATPEGPLYQACADIAKSDEITNFNFAHVVAMPNLYARLRPEPPKQLNPTKTEAKIFKPGENMGKINEPERFFVKLVKVGALDSFAGGNLFEVNDRSGNIGIFYAQIPDLESVIKLGDCFAIHATPTRFLTTTEGKNCTLFRSVEVLQDTIILGKVSEKLFSDDDDLDSTGGKFTRK